MEDATDCIFDVKAEPNEGEPLLNIILHIIENYTRVGQKVMSRFFVHAKEAILCCNMPGG